MDADAADVGDEDDDDDDATEGREPSWMKPEGSCGVCFSLEAEGTLLVT